MNSESSGSTTTNIVNVSGAKITNTIISFVSGNTVSTAPLTLLDKDILCPELFQDITDFSNKDKGIIPDIFLTTYFTFGSHFCSNRVMIQVGDRKPISSNQMVTIIANSGKGKGYVFDFFYKPILEIQSRLIKRDNTQTKFVNSCKAYLNKNEKVTEEDKEKHAWGYCNKLNIDYRKFSLDEIIPEIFTVTSFTPESLAENFGQSKNNSILLCFNEFEDLKENISRTGTVENIFSYLIEYIDGKSEIITRKTKETIETKDSKLSVVVATIPETFEKLKATELYSSGLGYRGKFLIIEEIDNNSPEDVKKSESGISIYEQHKARFANIFETFFFNAVYNSTNENTLLRINDDFNLKIYNDCIRKLWDEFIGNNDDLTDRQKETFKNRLHTKFQKNIQENYVGNYAYSMHFNDNLYPDNGSMLIFPINGKNYIDLSEQDILRGYNATRFDLNKSTVVFSTEERSDLTPRQQKVIELLEVGVAKQAKELLKEAINKNSISKAAFYVLIKRKSNQFTISDNIRHGKLITRNF